MKRTRTYKGSCCCLLLGACQAPVSGSDSAAVVSPAPAITAVTWSCDVDSATWSFAVDTTGWTAGGVLWITADVDRAEKHSMPSTKAASDGSTDHLELSLGVVSDWRYAVWGSTTGWRCIDEPELSFLVGIYAEDGSGQADCRTWGASADIWAQIPGGPTCDTPLETGDTGG